jgi:hypothetical protein
MHDVSIFLGWHGLCEGHLLYGLSTRQCTGEAFIGVLISFTFLAPKGSCGQRKAGECNITHLGQAWVGPSGRHTALQFSGSKILETRDLLVLAHAFHFLRDIPQVACN